MTVPPLPILREIVEKAPLVKAHSEPPDMPFSEIYDGLRVSAGQIEDPDAAEPVDLQEKKSETPEDVSERSVKSEAQNQDFGVTSHQESTQTRQAPKQVSVEKLNAGLQLTNAEKPAAKHRPAETDQTIKNHAVISETKVNVQSLTGELSAQSAVTKNKRLRSLHFQGPQHGQSISPTRSDIESQHWVNFGRPDELRSSNKIPVGPITIAPDSTIEMPTVLGDFDHHPERSGATIASDASEQRESQFQHSFQIPTAMTSAQNSLRVRIGNDVQVAKGPNTSGWSLANLMPAKGTLSVAPSAQPTEAMDAATVNDKISNSIDLSGRVTNVDSKNELATAKPASETGMMDRAATKEPSTQNLSQQIVHHHPASFETTSRPSRQAVDVLQDTRFQIMSNNMPSEPKTLAETVNRSSPLEILLAPERQNAAQITNSRPNQSDSIIEPSPKSSMPQVDPFSSTINATAKRDLPQNPLKTGASLSATERLNFLPASSAQLDGDTRPNVASKAQIPSGFAFASTEKKPKFAKDGTPPVFVNKADDNSLNATEFDPPTIAMSNPARSKFKTPLNLATTQPGKLEKVTQGAQFQSVIDSDTAVLETPVNVSSDKRVENTIKPSSVPVSLAQPEKQIQQIATQIVNAQKRITEIMLSPQELGTIRLTLQTTETGVTLVLQAERPETSDVMRRHIDQLAQEFKNLGFSDLNFAFGGETPSGAGSNESPQHNLTTDAESAISEAELPTKPRSLSGEHQLDIRL